MGFDESIQQTRQMQPLVQPAFISQMINEILQLEIDQALPHIEACLARVTPQNAGEDYDQAQTLLKALWEYYEALRIAAADSDFNEAGRLLQSAVAGFQKAGHAELCNVAVAMSAYAQATLEFRNFNIRRALELFQAVKQHLRSAGKFGNRFHSLIDHMEPDALFAAGANAVMEGDYDTAGTLIEKSAAASEKVANTYHPKDSPQYNSFMGMSSFHRAYFQFFSALHDFNCFRYDKIASSPDLAAHAHEAKRLLDIGVPGNAIVRAQSSLAEAFAEMLTAVQGTAKIMQSLLKSSFKQDTAGLQKLRARAERARELISRGGPQAVPMLRLCSDIVEKTDNIERLAKPGKKDFGAYSGLISCALFLPLFLLISWANSRFDTGLEGNRLILSSIGLALVGGFGVAALKFKGLFWGTAAAG